MNQHHSEHEEELKFLELLSLMVRGVLKVAKEIDDLGVAITGLKTAVDAAVAKLGTTPPAPVDLTPLVQMATDLNAMATTLNALTQSNPPPLATA